MQAVKLSLEARLCQLIGKEHKDGKDFKEIDLLYRQIERQCRIEKYQQNSTESDRNASTHHKKTTAPNPKGMRLMTARLRHLGNFFSNVFLITKNTGIKWD